MSVTRSRWRSLCTAIPRVERATICVTAIIEGQLQGENISDKQDVLDALGHYKGSLGKMTSEIKVGGDTRLWPVFHMTVGPARTAPSAGRRSASPAGVCGEKRKTGLPDGLLVFRFFELRLGFRRFLQRVEPFAEHVVNFVDDEERERVDVAANLLHTRNLIAGDDDVEHLFVTSRIAADAVQKRRAALQLSIESGWRCPAFRRR